MRLISLAERIFSLGNYPLFSSFRKFGIILLVMARSGDWLTTLIGLQISDRIHETNLVAAWLFREIGFGAGMVLLGLGTLLSIICVVEGLCLYMRRQGMAPITVGAVGGLLYLLPALIWVGVGYLNLRLILSVL